MTTALDTVRYECGIAGEEIADMVDSLEKENDQLRERVKTLLGYCEAQMRKDKAISYERCHDCDYGHKCSREVGCLGIKDHSPIMSKALAATEHHENTSIHSS